MSGVVPKTSNTNIYKDVLKNWSKLIIGSIMGKVQGDSKRLLKVHAPISSIFFGP